MNIDMGKATQIADDVIEKLSVTHGAENVKLLYEGALNILRNGNIVPDETGAFELTMPATGESLMLMGNMCECPQYKAVNICVHSMAVRIFSAMDPPPAQQQAPAREAPQRQTQQQTQQRAPQRQQQTQQRQTTQQQTRTPARQQERQAARPMDAQAIIAQANGIVEPFMEQIRTLLPIQPGLSEDKVLARYKSGLVMYLSQKPELANAEQLSLMDCLIKAAMQGFILGHDAYVNLYGKKAVLIPEYRGLIRAAMNTGKVRRVWADYVGENDTWKFDQFAQPPASHEPHPTHRGKPMFYYAALVELNGTVHIRITSLEKITQIRDNVLAKIRDDADRKFSPWTQELEPMSLKTAIKQLFKFVHLTPELSAIVDNDDVREYSDMAHANFEDNVANLYGDRLPSQAMGVGR